jgi:hypothetical protein
MRQKVFSAVLSVGLSLIGAAAFASGEGIAVGVNPDAIAKLQSEQRTLQVGADVSVGDTVVTGSAGQVQTLFDDQTKLVVGPSSSLLIETYLLASSTSAQKLTIDALGGSFRFITGNSPKPAYSIRTPTATIAVRGTEFDIIVDRSSTRVILYKGALQICNNAGTCQELTKRCEIGVASAQDTELFRINDPERAPLSQQFRYARFQTPLLGSFRVSGASKCVGEPQASETPESLFTLETGSGEGRDPSNNR